MALEPGTILGPYKITGPLGSGGMGEVYRANDTRLGRNIAIKVLPHRFATEKDALARFEREAMSLASLSHPNILTIHDFGKQDEITYAVMELLEGETLRSRLQKSALPPDKVIEIGKALAEGLAAAHSKGVVHRDLKPENIFLTAGGGIKILDFGLARFDQRTPMGESAAPTRVVDTEPGTVLGSIGYMAPEQVRGKEVDARSDIFSLGCVLYEMVTGIGPFRRDTNADTLAAILSQDPPQISSSGKHIAPEIDHVIFHCLEKDPDERFQSARDLAFALKEIGGASKTSFPAHTMQTRKRHASIFWAIPIALALFVAGFFYVRPYLNNETSGERIPVAVADFVNETGEKDLDGLSGMLITSLEQSRRLSVMTRARMFDQLKQMGKETAERIDESVGREICKSANVRALVLASIRKFDQLYTIDLKVLDPDKNEYLFTAKQEGNGKASVPEMIDKLAEKTRAGLKEKSAEIASTNKKVADVTTANLQAYHHFFQGEQHINKVEFEEAATEFKKATELDPSFALAWVRLAYATAWFSNTNAQQPMAKAFELFDKLPPREQFFLKGAEAFFAKDVEKSKQIYREALLTYPNDKEFLFILGDWSYHDGDFETAYSSFKKVLELDPNFERALQHMIWTCNAMNRFEDTIHYSQDYFKRSGKEDALRYSFDAFLNKGDFPRAEEIARQAISSYPGEADPHLAKIRIMVAKEQYQEAEKEFARLLAELQGDENQEIIYSDRKWFYAFRGQYRNAIADNEKSIALLERSKDKNEQSGALAIQSYFQFARGDSQTARDFLQKALTLTSPGQYSSDTKNILEALLILKDFDKAEELATKEMWSHVPFIEMLVQAHKSWDRKDYASAIRDLSFIAEHGLLIDRAVRSYELALCTFEAGKYDQTIQTIHRMNETFFNRQLEFYPLSFYWMGRAHEAKGEIPKAKENYSKFLRLWEKADPDLKQLVDAKSRMSRL